jgi:DNA-binding MarR family transcriptional regulator
MASIIPLLTNWEEYIGQVPGGNLKGFAHWILSRPQTDDTGDLSPSTGTSISTPAEIAIPPAETSLPTPHLYSAGPAGSPGIASLGLHIDLDETAQATLLITRLTRLLRVLSKPAMKKLGFVKEMEFGLLVQISLMDHPNKKEVCHQLLIETSTGVEITKRLAKKGFLREATDPNDRRSSRLSLTEKGRTTLQMGFKMLAGIHIGFLDTLGQEEKKTLVLLLARLNDHHNQRLKDNPAGIL